MNPQETNAKEEKTNVCGGFERMFEMISQFCKGGESLPDCSSMVSMLENCCRPKTENKGEGSQG